jgi:putative transposase
MVYVAFVVDAYARRILGWRASTSMRTELVLDAIEQAIWTRQRDGVTNLAGLTHHHDNGLQYTSIAFTERLTEAGIDASVGAVGDALDNALAESVIGLFKTELIRRRGPWRTVEHVEAATLAWVDWSRYAGDLVPGQWDREGRSPHRSETVHGLHPAVGSYPSTGWR